MPESRFFGPLPKPELDLDQILQWVQNNVQTFHKSVTLSGTLSSVFFDPNTPGSQGWQLEADGDATFLGQFNVGSNVVGAIQFIRANEAHLSFVEIDALTTDVFNIDVAGGVMRHRFLDLDASTVAPIFNANQDGSVDFFAGQVSAVASITANGLITAPLGTIAVATQTSSQTGITTEADVTSLTATWTALADRRYKLTAFLPIQQLTNGGTVIGKITDDSNTEVAGGRSTLTATFQDTMHLVAVITPSAGSVTYKVRASSTASSLTIRSTDHTAWFIVEDIGPA